MPLTEDRPHHYTYSITTNSTALQLILYRQATFRIVILFGKASFDYFAFSVPFKLRSTDLKIDNREVNSCCLYLSLVHQYWLTVLPHKPLVSARSVPGTNFVQESD